MKIKDIMSKKLITCSSNSDIYNISKLMKENNIGFIPIVDEELKGVITDRDIVVKAIYNKDTDSIKPYINDNVISIETNKNIEDALNLMGDKKVKRLVVKDNEKLVGVLSISDIINSNIDNNVYECIKKIWELKDNSQNKNSKVDEFNL